MLVVLWQRSPLLAALVGPLLAISLYPVGVPGRPARCGSRSPIR